MQAWRGHHARTQLAQKRTALVILTAAVPRMKAFLAGQAERREFAARHRAAATLQKVARGHLARCRFARIQRAVLVLQAWARGHTVRRGSSRKVCPLINAVPTSIATILVLFAGY